MSPLPLRGKVPAVAWEPYQSRRPTRAEIDAWAEDGLFENVGLVCGAVSGGLVVVDLDGKAAYAAFAERFPHFTRTYTVATGSGMGRHVYLFARNLPASTQAINTTVGNVELRANGLQVAAPPSVHPRTGRAYAVCNALPVKRVDHLQELIGWIATLRRTKPTPQATTALPRKPVASKTPARRPTEPINPRLVAAITAHFQDVGFQRRGDWLNGPCIYPENHRHGDANPSFGFNTRTGYGFCWVCGSMLARDIAEALGIASRSRS